MTRFCSPIHFALLMFLLAVNPARAATDQRLPDLGGAGGGLVTPAQERELGMAWLRMYRGHVPSSTDPFVQDYLERLVRELSIHSDLDHRSLELVVVKNPTINAFAVPGGVLGVHTGLFLFAENEQQLSSVLAHELAHLSQRHYARGLQRQKNSTITTMAAMLAGLVVAATADGEAGMAAIAAAQAGALDQQLRYSRTLEREADRVGMNIMAKAGKDPHAMSEMFEVMLRALRFTRRPPEFLLSHPVTESRVSDARQRADRLDKKPHNEDLEYHLVKARIELAHETDPQKALRKFSGSLGHGSPSAQVASRYGLAMAHTRLHNLEQAREVLAPLLEKDPNNTAYVIAAADIDTAAKNYEAALARLQDALARQPNSHPLNIRYAETLMSAGLYAKGEKVLEAHIERRPSDPYVWYLLAETYGLAGHILDVHKARAEYFVLVGRFTKAEIQLNNALTLLTEEDVREKARLNQRLNEVRELKENNPL